MRSLVIRGILEMGKVLIAVVILVGAASAAHAASKQGPSVQIADYIVQFTGETVASKAEKSGLVRAEAKQALAAEHYQFRQDLARIRNLPSGKAANSQPDPIRHEYFTVFNGAALSMTAKEAETVAALPYVKAVYPDQEYRTNLADSVPLVRADEVWGTLGATGAGVVVAVIDTGVDYTHSDLGGGFGPSYKVIGGYDFYSNDADPMDDQGHGTHVAGIVAANGSLMGVAPDAKILAYKVFGPSRTGIGADVVAAIERACDPDQNPLTDDKADVISMSLGSDEAGAPDAPTVLAANAAAALGVVCVASAGNDGNYRTIGAPACAADVLAVGATDKSDIIAGFSSRGPALYTDYIKPEICAPGVSIVSAAIGGGTMTKQGTSMACPHVSGAAALLIELHPTWNQAQIRSALVGSAVDLGVNVVTQGAGRLDAFEAADCEVILTPNPINLGTGHDEFWEEDVPITVTNVSNHSITYSISIDDTTLPSGATASINSSITLGAGASGSLTLHLSVGPGVQQKVDWPYLYYGRVVAQSGGKKVTAPFGFNRVPYDVMEPNNDFSEATPIVLTDVRTQIGAEGATVITPLQPGASDPDEDWYTFYAQQGDRISAAILTFEILSPLGLPILEVYGDSPAEPIFAQSNGDNPIVHRTPIIEVPNDGMYLLRVAGNPVLHTTGAYRLFISRLPREVTLWKQLVSPYEAIENRMEYVSFATLSDSGNYLHAMQYAPPANYDRGQTLNHFLFNAPSATPVYTAADPYRPAFQASAHAGSTSISVASPRADLTTWTYDGLDWSHLTPAANPGRRYMAGMAFDSARGVVVLFGGFDEAANTTDETWTWDGVTWILLSPAHSPSSRYVPRMAFDESRGVIVLHGGETVDPMTGAIGNENDTWEWNGTDWTEVHPATVPPKRSTNTFAYDSDRNVVVMFGGLYHAGGGSGNETWEYDGTNWTLRTPATSAPFSFTSAIAYDVANSEMLMCVDQETWAYDGVDWSQKVTATPLNVGEFAMVYDTSRSAMVLIAQPGAGDDTLRTNRTYEWSGANWALVSTVHEPSKRAFFNAVFDDVRNEVVLFGGWPLLTTTQLVEVRQTPSSTPLLSEWLEFPENITGLGISADGTRIVDSKESGDIRVRNAAGTVVDVIVPPQPARLRSLSTNGSVAVIEQAGDLVPFDIASETVRPGVTVDAADHMNLSGDGTFVLTAQGLTGAGYLWNGTTYIQQWTFPIPDASVLKLRKAALSEDGSLGIVVGTGPLGPGNPAGTVSAYYYFLSGSTGSLLYSYHKDIDPLIVLAGINGQGFLHFNAVINEDGTLAAISDYSFDFSHSELAVFTPAVNQPILQLGLPAPVTSMDLTGNTLAVGDGEEARENWSDVLVVDLTSRLDDYDGDGISNDVETNADTDGDGIQNWLDPDSDNDGLPDSWESENGLDPLDDGSVDPNNGPTGDPDDDGRTNEDELLRGYDPHNANDIPAAPVVAWPLATALMFVALAVLSRRIQARAK